MVTRSTKSYCGRFSFQALLVLLLSPFVAIPVASQDVSTTADASVTSETTWTGCVDPENGYEPVTIGQPTTVCLVLANDGDWSSETTYMRLNFKPTADEYSRFHVPQSFSQLVGSGEQSDVTDIFTGNITVHTESQTALSFQKQYYNGNDKVYPYLTAIITVEQGNVTGITWDNACVFCKSDECENNTYNYNGEIVTEEEAQQQVGSCFTTVEECKTSEKAECDLMLYVVWTGTDANGRDFVSSANRFSAFPAQSWGDRVDLGLPDWLNNLPSWAGGGNDESNN